MKTVHRAAATGVVKGEAVIVERVVRPKKLIIVDVRVDIVVVVVVATEELTSGRIRLT